MSLYIIGYRTGCLSIIFEKSELYQMANKSTKKKVLTIPLTEVIRAGEEGSRRYSTVNKNLSNPKPALQEDFSNVLELAKLPLKRDKFRSSNPSMDKLPEAPFLPRLVSGSGDKLDSSEFSSTTSSGHKGFLRKGSSRSRSRPTSSNQYTSNDEDEVDETMKKIQGFLKRRNIAKSKLDTEIHSRISKAYDTMETLEKGVKTFDDSLKLAKGRVFAAASGSGPQAKKISTLARPGSAGKR